METTSQRCPTCKGAGVLAPDVIDADGRIGAILSAERQRQGLTQHDVAKRLGLNHQGQVSALERTAAPIGPSQAAGRLRYAEILGVALTLEQRTRLEEQAQPRPAKAPRRRGGRPPLEEAARQAAQQERREATRPLWQAMVRQRELLMISLRQLAARMRQLDPAAPYVDAARLSRMERGLEGSAEALARIVHVLDTLLEAQGGEAAAVARYREGWNRPTWRRKGRCVRNR